MLCRLFCMTALILGGGVTPAWSWFEDFDASSHGFTVQTVGNGGTFSYLGGADKYAKVTGSGTFDTLFNAGFAATHSDVFTTTVVAATVNFESAGSSPMSILARSNGNASAPTGYGLLYAKNDNTFDLVRTNGNLTNITYGASIASNGTTSNQYRLELKIEGSDITARVFNFSTNSFVGTMNWTESSYASGITGISSAGLFSYAATYDDVGGTGVLGDANFDQTVNFADFVILSNNFGLTNRLWDQGDFNLDGVVSFADFVILSNNFGLSASPEELAAMNAFGATHVPEPTSLTLCAVGLGVLAWRHRRMQKTRKSSLPMGQGCV